MTACEHDHSDLLAYGRGELDEATQRAVAQHLLDCPAAQAEYAELTDVHQMLSVSPEGKPLPHEFFLEGSPDADRPGGGAVLQGALSRVHAERTASQTPPSVDPGSPGTLPSVEQARYHPHNGHTPQDQPLLDQPWASATTTLPAPTPQQQPWPNPPAQKPASAPTATATATATEGAVTDLNQRQRHRGRTLALVAAAAAVLALVAGMSVVVGRATAPAVVIAAPTGATPSSAGSQFTIRTGDITAAAILTPAQGWVRVALTTTGIPSGQRCSIVVINRDGTETAAGSWVVPVNEAPTGPPTVSGSAAVPADAVAAVEIRDPAGHQIVSIPTI